YVGNNPWTYVDPYGLGWWLYVWTGVYDMPKGSAPVTDAQISASAAQGTAEGARGGASIAASTMSFGSTDRLGLTDSSQYQGSAYDASRIAATVSRETLITVGT